MIKAMLMGVVAITSNGMLQQPQQTEPAKTIRVYRLEHADINKVASTIKGILRVNAIADERTNSLLLHASGEELSTAEKIIESLDRPSSDETDMLSVVRVMNRETDDIAQKISQLYPHDLKVSSDSQGHRVMLRGDQKAIAAAEQIITDLDQPLPSATIHFAFFQLSDAESKPEIVGPIPPDLREIANELLRFGSPRLVGRTMTATLENEEFKVSGGVAEQSKVLVNCRLSSAAEDGVVVMHIKADLDLDDPEAGEMEEVAGTDGKKIMRPKRSRRRQDFSLATTISVPRGDYVILGGAPHGFEPGQSVVLVVHVPK